MLAAGAVAAAAMPAQAELANGIQAVVHDAVITYQQVEILNAKAFDQLRRDYAGQPGQRELFLRKAAEVQTNNVEKLVNDQLVLHEFKTAGYNLPESIVDDEVQERIKARYGDRMTATRTLAEDGITYDRYREQVRDQIILAAMRQKNVSAEIIISPHKVESYYQAHRDEFKMDDEAKLRVIVLAQSPEPGAPSAQKLAEEILAKLKEGAAFAEMASVYSQGSQRNQGGDWGWKELSQLNKMLADIASSLQPGQHSGVLSRSAGDDFWLCQYENGRPTLGRHYLVDPASRKEKLVEEQRFDDAAAAANLPPPQEFYLILVEDKRVAHFKPLSEVRDQIEQDLRLQERGRLEKRWYERLRKKTFVSYFLP